MLNIKGLLTEFVQDESGLTAVEYAIAGGLVVGGMVAAFVTLGTGATAKIQCLSNAVDGTAVVAC
jgi:pilus assembly protein Flp/PilA